MSDISRALTRHDANAAYTLLRENYSEGVAGRLLLELIKTVPDWPKVGLTDAHEYLSPRELTVLRLLELGRSTDEIARELPLSPHTVMSHKKSIYLKLDASNVAEAVHKARELGIL
jgi:LuxR family maltose regulon positive regulatory protein